MKQSCCGKGGVNDTCGGKINARCVEYEGKLSICTELPECSKYPVHYVLEDLQSRLSEICNFLDKDSIDTDCIEVLGEEGSLSTHINKIYSELCTIKGGTPEISCESIKDVSIECFNLDYKCLTPEGDPCGDALPSTIGEFFQFIIDSQCNQGG